MIALETTDDMAPSRKPIITMKVTASPQEDEHSVLLCRDAAELVRTLGLLDRTFGGGGFRCSGEFDGTALSMRLEPLKREGAVERMHRLVQLVHKAAREALSSTGTAE